MPAFSAPIWLLLAGAACFGVIGVLYQLAVVVRNDLFLHDLKMRVIRLRVDQAIKVRDLMAAVTATVEQPKKKANAKP